MEITEPKSLMFVQSMTALPDQIEVVGLRSSRVWVWIKGSENLSSLLVFFSCLFTPYPSIHRPPSHLVAAVGSAVEEHQDSADSIDSHWKSYQKSVPARGEGRDTAGEANRGPILKRTRDTEEENGNPIRRAGHWTSSSTPPRRGLWMDIIEEETTQDSSSIQTVAEVPGVYLPFVSTKEETQTDMGRLSLWGAKPCL